MRAVWSFWSKPFEDARGRRWRDPLHHLLAWGLSVRLARRHYPQCVLVTDSPGKAMLVDELRLPFTHVSTELDQLADADSAWWALGKLLAYSIQKEPFVHLDTDVFLWRRLPRRLIAAPVLAQHPEPYHLAERYCGPRLVEDAFARVQLTLPREWAWARSHWGLQFRETNCGILGATNVEFIGYYARQALDLVLNPRYAAAWATIEDKDGLNQIIEQFTLAACLDFHRFDPSSPFAGVHARYLFPSLHSALHSGLAGRLGFTHLLGDAKSNERVGRRIEQRMHDEDAGFYRRCLRLSEHWDEHDASYRHGAAPVVGCNAATVGFREVCPGDCVQL